MKNLNAWVEELRAPFFTASILPVFLGALIAWNHSGTFRWGYFLLTLLGVICLHAGTNIINDYFDHRSGNDECNTEFVRPFTGGSRLIQKGNMTPNEVLFESLLFFTIGSAIGLFLAYSTGLTVLWMGMIGVFSGFCYSAPPLRLAGRGIGELVVGANFGVLVTLGAYFVQIGHLAWEPIFAAIPISILIAAVLYINEFPDFNADRAVGKNNLVVRLGKKKAAWGFAGLISSIFVYVTIAAWLGLISAFSLIIFLILPLAVKTIKIALSNYANTSSLVPANMNTILLHMLGGLLLSLAYFLQKLL